MSHHDHPILFSLQQTHSPAIPRLQQTYNSKSIHLHSQLYTKFLTVFRGQFPPKQIKMHYQSTTAISALLLALSSTTMANGMKAMCERHSLIALANGNAPDCEMVECDDKGMLMMMSAPKECEGMCKCPAPEKSTNAPVVKDNPIGVEFNATLPESEKSTIRGYFTGMSSDNGMGVDFQILLYGLPDGLGPFCKLISLSHLCMQQCVVAIQD